MLAAPVRSMPGRGAGGEASAAQRVAAGPAVCSAAVPLGPGDQSSSVRPALPRSVAAARYTTTATV